MIKSRKGNYQDLFQQTIKKGFTQCRIDGEIVDISNSTSLERYKNHDIEIVIDKLFLEKEKYYCMKMDIIYILNEMKLKKRRKKNTSFFW